MARKIALIPAHEPDDKLIDAVGEDKRIVSAPRADIAILLALSAYAAAEVWLPAPLLFFMGGKGYVTDKRTASQLCL